MTWGGGYFTAWSRKRQKFARYASPTSSGMTREEVEQCELEIWSKLASIQTGREKGGEKTLH